MLSLDLMQRMWPHGNSKVPGLVEGIAASAATVFPKYGLTSDLLIAHAMAQFSHECGAGSEMTENIRYTARRACAVWPSRFQNEADVYRKVGSFAGDPAFPVKLIDNVYGNRMGNRPGTHDGSTFIGRGLSQTTGREGYQKLGAKMGLDLIADPEQVNTPAHALEAGVADFIMCGCLPFAQQDDISGVTFHLNGGHIGQSERETWLKKWKTALGAASPAMHGTVWLQQSLNALGAEPPLVDDGSFGPLTAAAVKAFQALHGLEVDGKANPATIAAIEAALPTA
ncbi:MAG: putative glycohydrolase [Xanthobacteraceae bacterium]|jgi:putative chitinase|nr:putative glycohydrolase [Xanthobacteraceae bacterium]